MLTLPASAALTGHSATRPSGTPMMTVFFGCLATTIRTFHPHDPFILWVRSECKVTMLTVTATVLSFRCTPLFFDKAVTTASLICIPRIRCLHGWLRVCGSNAAKMAYEAIQDSSLPPALLCGSVGFTATALSFSLG